MHHRELNGRGSAPTGGPPCHRMPFTGWRGVATMATIGLPLLLVVAAAPGTAGVEETVGFREIPGAEAGLDFVNLLPDRLLVGNVNLANGSGVAAGDFDGDGWCDLYFCAIAGTNALYRNLGGWRFTNVTAQAGLTQPHPHCTGAVLADVTGDGAPELLVASLGGGVHFFLNDGHGRFRDATATAGLRSRFGTTTMALADVDRDGDLDLYLANYGERSFIRSSGRAEMRLVDGRWEFTGPMAGRLRWENGRIIEVGEPDLLLLNDGSGRFLALPWSGENFVDAEGRPVEAPLDFGLTAQFRDIDQDGFPDLYVANDFQTPDRLWFNERGRRFRLASWEAMRHESFSAMSVDFADIDRDGRLDFFVTEMWPRDHRVRLRQATGLTLQVPEPGRVDDRPGVVRNTLFWNRGDGTWAEIAAYAGVAASDWTWSQAFVDVDLDGYEDLLVVNGMVRDVQDKDTHERLRAAGPQTVEASRTNILAYPPYLSPNIAWRNRGDLTFEDRSQAWGFAATNVSTGLALADLDNDGDLDVALNTLQGGPLLYRNVTAAPRLAVRLEGPPANRAGVGARIRVTGGPVPVQEKEILAGGRYLSGDQPLAVFAAGSPEARLKVEVFWPDGRFSRVEAVPPGRTLTVRYAESNPAPAPPASRESPSAHWFEEVTTPPGRRHHEEFFPDYLRQPLLHRQFSTGGPGLAWADFDADGREELAVGSGRGGRLGVLDRQGGAWKLLATAANSPPVGRDLTTLLPLPASDGRVELLAGASHYEDGRISGAAVRAWSAADGRWRDLIPTAEAAVGPLALADVDADGDLDLFVGGQVIPGRYPEPASSRLFRRQNGEWREDAEARELLAGVGLVNAAVWTDLTGDGFPELALACEWGPLKLFRNERGRLAPWDPPLEGAPVNRLNGWTGWWQGLQAADVNGDGRMDLVAGNWGLNSDYAASVVHPLRLYFADFFDQGTVDLIEACWVPEAGHEAPRRSLTSLARAFPILRSVFPTHRAFSEAPIRQVLDALPRPARRVEAVNLASGVFLNRGDRFEWRPLPAQAQWTPIFGIGAADFDGNGVVDLFLAQNFFAVRPELPRQDAGFGLLLKGDGRGAFTPVAAREAGFRIPGEGRGVAVADWDQDGRPELAVGQNGGPTVLLRNRQGRPGLRVALTAGPGNPWAVGAVVRVGDGRQWGPATEVRLGGGWWSADAPTVVLARRPGWNRLRVVWPGGAVTEHELAGETREVRLSSPPPGG
ncbi:MAG: hypothetical protein D6766_13005 [Verrucomicrobia bacterium]|nr:MAG: hypothetical protein D6766_13005 [Verrucomicrobiota bacterium]